MWAYIKSYTCSRHFCFILFFVPLNSYFYVTVCKNTFPMCQVLSDLKKLQLEILLFCFRTKARTAGSIILRGPNDFYCDEMERSIHDSLCVIKRVLESKNVVVGGGCVEAALSIYLENFATTISSREQLAIAEFAKSLLVIPKTLAVNAAKDATDLVAKLRAHHNSSQTKLEMAHLKW